MKNYDYKNVMVDTYDFSPFMAKDKDKIANPFYLSECEKAGKNVLIYGSATGILAVPLVKRGFKVDCIDISPEMLGYIKEKLQNEDESVKNNINLIEANMITYLGDKKYDVIALPDNVLLAATTFTDQMNLLKNAKLQLRDGGKLIFDIFTADRKIVADRYETSSCEFFTNKKTHYFCTRYTTVNPLLQVLTIKFMHKILNDNDEVEKEYFSKIKFRYIYPAELVLMLKYNGFTINHIYGDFNRNIRTNFEDLQVVVATS